MEALRLFIAVPLPDFVRQALQDDVALLRGCCACGSATRRENLHLTLAFLGDTEADRLTQIAEAMDACEKGRITLTLGAFGRFTAPDGAVLWRGIDGGTALISMQRALCARLRGAGLSVDRKPYRPHLTLLRRAQLKDDVKLKDLSAKTSPLRFEAREITLFSSAVENGRRVYTPLHRSFL